MADPTSPSGRVCPAFPDTGYMLAFLEERTVRRVVLTGNFDWAMLVEISLGQPRRYFELDGMKKFAAWSRQGFI